jgi:hypothetical protein
VSPIGFLRRLRYEGVKDVALVQTGSADLVARVAGRIRRIFPGCVVHVVLRSDAGVDREALAGAFVEVARPGERRELLGRLRRKTFDVVVVELTEEPLGELASVALCLRGRSLVAFNQNLDHFPLNVYRLTTIAQHFGTAGSGGAQGLLSFVLRSLARLAAGVLAAGYLVGVAAWIHLRGAVRRRRRSVAPGGA